MAAKNQIGTLSVGEIAKGSIKEIGLKAIAVDLDEGNFIDADHKRQSLGLNWSEIIGIDQNVRLS